MRALTLVALAVAAAACTHPDSPDEAPAGEACYQGLDARGIAYERIRDALPEHPAGHDELACAIADPVLLAPVQHGVTFRYAAHATAKPFATSCALALRLDRMAAVLAARGITGVVHLGSYNCRFVAGSEQLSLHASARAFDIVQLERGRGAPLDVERDWPGPSEASRALHDLVADLHARELFNVILTPDQDLAHRNHLHVDLTPGRRFVTAPGGAR